MSKEGTNNPDIGPSYWDAERLLEEIEFKHDCAVLITMTCTRTGKIGQRAWWLQAHAKPRRQLDKPSKAVGAFGLRGVAGAKTMPAALYHALLELLSKLDDDLASVEQASFM